ncbi:class I SAM-dependent methyltransferase [Gemmata sp. JC717]|uniref:class I SAM-dependent methyltransferase n=1 Tax=Gemmata algarum TaxID=2975278 RepID=UPI0021BB8C68|nr:class I SAM-dependent methyltransferase [Gemmata algarum]MDY3555648.1 class I SAM-dependent methyltransferase [Gemmata algarum]
MSTTDYVLGQSERAARRLELQDRHFAAPSEALLDALDVCPDDRVVELGCGPGAFTRRILHRLGPDGAVVGVDSSPHLLEHATAALNTDRFRPTLADVAKPGAWLDGAGVVLGRAVLHHVPMAEFLVGRLRAVLPAGTRVGFLEPDFRRPLAQLARAEQQRPELAPLVTFARAINELYAARRISPAVGASLAPAMYESGYREVKHVWHPFATDESVLENMALIYDEVRDTLAALNIITGEEIVEQQKALRALPVGDLPAVWGLHQVTAVA